MNEPPTRARGPEPRISAEECQKLLDTVRKRCPGLLPSDPVKPGTVVDDVALTPAEAAALFPTAAALAAGVDQPGADPNAPVLWREGDLELLVQPAGVTARFATGVVVVTIPVSCDQTGDTQVHVTFVVGDQKRPAGLLAATEQRPFGPAVIVDAWGDNLVAYAWHVVIEVMTNGDRAGRLGGAGRDVGGAGPDLPAQRRRRAYGAPGWTFADTATPVRSPAADVDAPLPRAVTFDTDFTGQAAGKRFLLVAVVHRPSTQRSCRARRCRPWCWGRASRQCAAWRSSERATFVIAGSSRRPQSC